MANTVIQLKKSSTPSAVPGTLEFGELALNYADGKLYYKNTNSQIAEISGSGGPSGGNAFGTVNANNVLVIADTPSDVLTLEAGDNITIVGDAINDKITISSSANITPAFDKANVAYDAAGAAFDKANTPSGGGTISVGNTLLNIYTLRSTQSTINFIPGDNVYINVDDDTAGGRANVRISANAPGGWWAPTTSVVTENTVTAVKDTRYFLTNTSSTTVTLPSAPSQGDTIYVVVTNQLSNNIIARNGSKIMSLDEDLTLDITYYSIGLAYIDANLGWVII